MQELQIAHIEYSIATKSIDIFTIGCNGTCKNCCNPEIKNWSLKGMSVEHALAKILKLNNKFDKLIDKIIIVGGDPVDAWYNTKGLESLITITKNEISKPIFLFTRHELENIPLKLKKIVDYVKTGEYIPELTIENNIQYGIKLATSNQNIYKMEDKICH